MGETMGTAATWCCSDCIGILANGEYPSDWSEERCEEWAISQDDDVGVTIGRAIEVCGCQDWDTDHHRDYCEYDDFSWSRCDVCGSTLGGARYAVTLYVDHEARAARQEAERKADG